MMQPQKWWLGLIPLALIWGGAVWHKSADFEGVVETRAQALLKSRASTTLLEPKITVAGRDVHLASTEFAAGGGAAATALLARSFGVRKVSATTASLAVQKPYSLTVKPAKSGILISGYAPSPQVRDKMLEAVKNSSRSAVDPSSSLKFAAGSPKNLTQIVAFAAKQAARLESGEASVSGSAVSLNGVAKFSNAYAAIHKDWAALPAGLQRGKITVTAPPISNYTFSAIKSEKSLQLTGFVGDLESRKPIVEAAQKSAPGSTIQDGLNYAAGAPKGFASLVRHGLEQLGLLKMGEFTLKGNVYSLKGVASGSSQYGAVRKNLNALPNTGVAGRIDVSPPASTDYLFSVDRTAKGLVLNGQVPSVEARARLVDAANKALAGKKDAPAGITSDRLVYGGGGPKNFEDQAKASIALAARLKTGTVSLEKGAVAIKGVAPDSKTYAGMLDSVSKLPAGLKAGPISLDPPTTDAYSFSAQHKNNDFELAGHVPSPKMRKRLVALAATHARKTKIVDRMDYASGAPKNFETIAGIGLRTAAQLKEGAFVFGENAIRLTGEAKDSAAYTQLRGVAGRIPAGGSALHVSIRPPLVTEYSFAAGRDGKNITLSGQVPSLAARKAINIAAKKAVGDGNVTDRLGFASGAPNNFQAIAVAGVKLAGRLETGSFSINGGAASIQGNAPDSAGYSFLLEAMRKLPGNAKVALIDILPPRADPYTFAYTRNGNQVTLTGNIPSPAHRQRIIAAAEKTNRRVESKLTFAREEPPAFEKNVLQGIAFGSRLKDARFELSGSATKSKSRLLGDAPDHTAYRKIRAELAKLPVGQKPDEITIRPPIANPYVWNLVRDKNGITLSGFVPVEAERERIDRHVRRLFPGVAVINKFEIARGAPQGDFSAAADFALKQAQLLSSGRVTVSDGQLSLDGKAGDFKQALVLNKLAGAVVPAGLTIGTIKVDAPLPKKIGVTLPPATKVVVPVEKKPAPEKNGGARKATMSPGTEKQPVKIVVPALPPAGVKVTAAPIPPKPVPARPPKTAPKPSQPALEKPDTIKSGPPEKTAMLKPAVKGPCTPGADGAIGKAEIYFKPGDRRVDRKLAKGLAALLAVSKKCPDAKITLQGHADWQGSRRYNILLSSRRTFSVTRFLVGEGIARSRISTIGFGEDRPKGSNATWTGRAKNRRVDVLLK